MYRIFNRKNQRSIRKNHLFLKYRRLSEPKGLNPIMIILLLVTCPVVVAAKFAIMMITSVAINAVFRRVFPHLQIVLHNVCSHQSM